MELKPVVDEIQGLPRGSDFFYKIEATIQKSQATQKPFFVILIQIENLGTFIKRKPRYVGLNLMKELFQGLRRVVHPSQFIGNFQNGFGLIFDAVDAGHVDSIAQRLNLITTKLIREGHFNDLASRWSDIIQQFLHPSQPSVISSKVGWGIYPRDGQTSQQIVRRAVYHLKEMNR